MVLIFTTPFAILISLSYVGIEPRFYIHGIYIPALNTSINYTNLNTSIFMDLKFKRVVTLVPLRYRDINITWYYGSNTSFVVGYASVAGFK